MGTTKYVGVTVKAVAVAAIAITMAASAWAAGKEKVLLSFQGPDGGNPTAGLIADTEGNLYGTAADAGRLGFGNVFKLTRNKNGQWTQTVLYSFAGNDAGDGQGPLASLVFDGEGNLYGTTGGGGAHPPISDGTVFKLTPTKSGEWKETILHSFNSTEGKGDNDGCTPYSYLVFDKSGNLYGTTNKGGGGDFTTFCQNGCGTVFKLAPHKDGTWTESLIHTFPHGNGGTRDGQNPMPVWSSTAPAISTAQLMLAGTTMPAWCSSWRRTPRAPGRRQYCSALKPKSTIRRMGWPPMRV